MWSCVRKRGRGSTGQGVAKEMPFLDSSHMFVKPTMILGSRMESKEALPGPLFSPQPMQSSVMQEKHTGCHKPTLLLHTNPLLRFGTLDGRDRCVQDVHKYKWNF